MSIGWNVSKMKKVLLLISLIIFSNQTRTMDLFTYYLKPVIICAPAALGMIKSYLKINKVCDQRSRESNSAYMAHIRANSNKWLLPTTVIHGEAEIEKKFENGKIQALIILLFGGLCSGVLNNCLG